MGPSESSETLAVEKFRFKVTINLDDELDAFVRYSRLGLFKEAEELYWEVLKDKEDCFAVTAEGADCLLEQGRYGELLEFLEGKINQPEKYPFKDHEKGALRLLKSLADVHIHGKLHDALELAKSWRRAAETSMTPNTLSAVDAQSLRAYLRIVTLAHSNSIWVEPQDTQPPWEKYDTDSNPRKGLWSGFFDMCAQFGGNVADAWDAQALFRSLLTVLPREQAASLFRELDSKILGNGKLTEEELIAKLSITTAYVRHLLAGGETGDQVSSLVDGAQRMLDILELRITDLNDDLTDTRTRQFLELKLAQLAEEASLATDEEFYSLFGTDAQKQEIWKLADRNRDLVVKAAYLHIAYSGSRGAQLNRHLTGNLVQLWSNLMGDSMGYLDVMADRILSISKLARMSNPPKKPPTERTAKVFPRIIYQQMVDTAALKSGNLEASGFEYFEKLLYMFDVPFLRFKGSFARLTVANSLGEKEAAVAARRELVAIMRETPRPLHYMVENGHKKGVEILIEEKMNVNARDSNNQTPLIVAVKNREIEIALLLLDNEADVEAKDSDNQTSLVIAVKNRDVEMVKILIKNSKTVDKGSVRRLKIEARRAGEEINALVESALTK